MKNPLLIFLISSLLISCANFRPIENSERISLNTIQNINGTYEGTTLMYNLDRSLVFNSLYLDPSYTYTVNLELQDSTFLTAQYFANDSIFNTKKFKIKSFKDGFLNIKNKNTKLVLLPYIFGRIDVQKARLATNHDGQLILDISNFTSGAGLFIIELHAKTNRNTYLIPRAVIKK
jgi:hypothetical protein